MSIAQNVSATGAKRPLALMLTADRQIDRRILLEADVMQEHGWDVQILAMPYDGPETKPDPRVLRIGVSPHLHVREFLVLKLYRKARAVMPMNSPLMRRIKAFAWTYLVDQEDFYVDLFLGEALRHKADLVIAHDLPMLPVGVKAARTNGAKLVYDSHELFAEQEFSDKEKRSWHKIENAYIREADQVIAVNSSIAAELTKRYSITEVHVILNAERPHQVDRKFPHGLRQRLGLSDKAIIGLFQGGLSAGRNLETLVHAMELVNIPDLHLVFLGNGQMASPLLHVATKLGLSDRVHFLAAVPQDELLAVTASADFGIIPYQANCLNTYYCTPNKLFEFIAAEVPMIASDLPELRRFVADNHIGLTGDLASPAAAAGMISAIAADANGRQAFRERIGDVRKQISWDVEGLKFAKLLTALKPNRSVS